MAIEELDEELLKCPQCELSVLGTFFKTPLLFFSYTDVIQNKDFSDGNTRFWHVFVTDYLLTYSNEVSPALLNTFASMNTTRLQGYKKFGGYNTVKAMMDIALDEQGLMNAVQILKKYSLLRGLVKEGFNIENIIGSNKFSSMNAEDVAALVQGKLDSICNNSIVSVNKSSDMTKNASGFIDSFFTTPSSGLQTPFNFINSHCLGIHGGESLCFGSRTNSGKGRSLIFTACHLAMVSGAIVTFLSNEMDEVRMKQALLVTACNAPFAQKLTGCKLQIPEKRLVLASYLDDSTGQPMYRYYNKDGEYTETTEQYHTRVAKSSQEYQKVKIVTEYLEKNVQNKLFFKNVMSNYGDSALLRHFNQSAMVDGSNVIIYDTLKNSPSNDKGSDIGSWSQLVNTATMLQEATAKQKDVSLVMSFQLDRSAYSKRIEEINESNIAGASGIMHVVDNMVMFLHIDKRDYKDYKLQKPCEKYGKGETIGEDLDINKNYSAFKITKTRRGSKGSIFVTETDLNLNTWQELPYELVVEKPRAAKWNQ